MLINAENQHGTTPLLKAIEKGNYQIAELLINSGTDVNRKIKKE
ncbi:MAG: ankyrin repeat domain-containing protein [Rickettsia sp.]|nr:ankyrin repeat domain-containing protein [Rickettsia sp.]